MCTCLYYVHAYVRMHIRLCGCVSKCLCMSTYRNDCRHTYINFVYLHVVPLHVSTVYSYFVACRCTLMDVLLHMAHMTAVGFEPTQLALVELESTPLDHSGKLSLLAKERSQYVTVVIGAKTTDTTCHRIANVIMDHVCIYIYTSNYSTPSLREAARPA